jgi:hypothetical protein
MLTTLALKGRLAIKGGPATGTTWEDQTDVAPAGSEDRTVDRPDLWQRTIRNSCA